MRILVVTDCWFPDYVGGSARVARDTASALAHLGHTVVAVTPAASDAPRSEDAGGVQVKRAVPRLGPLPRTVTNVPGFRRAVQRELDDASFDVVLSHHLPGTAGVLRLRSRPPVVYVFHASPQAESRYRRQGGIPLGAKARAFALEPAFGRLERRVTRRVEKIFVLSNFSRSLLRADNASPSGPVAVVGGGVDVERFSPADHRSDARSMLRIEREEIVLLTVRRLVNRMGLDRLLIAFRDVLRDRPELKLVIIGDGEERGRLAALAEALGVSNRVIFAGRLVDEAVVAWYQAADLFVLPTVAYEGFGMVTAESLACGTPVIGTSVGATPEILEPLDHALIAPSPSVDDLGFAIRSILPELTPALRARCREYAEEHLSWASVIKNWERELQATASTGSASV